jgi:murein DD-endopeptidase MepM/ murein hydrolase activator NlpD
MPLDSYKLTSDYGSRIHPVYGTRRMHIGTDFSAPTGTPVRVTRQGEVVFAGWDGAYGYSIVVQHDKGFVTRYAHLSRIATISRKGRELQTGMVIGYVGSTGVSTGPHLHYEMHRYGRPVDAFPDTRVADTDRRNPGAMGGP